MYCTETFLAKKCFFDFSIFPRFFKFCLCFLFFTTNSSCGVIRLGASKAFFFANVFFSSIKFFRPRRWPTSTPKPPLESKAAATAAVVTDARHQQFPESAKFSSFCICCLLLSR